MASGRIKGITIEIGGDATPLQKALADVDKDLGRTQSALRDVDKLLKLDPKNVNLLRQKQELLTRAIDDTKKKLDTEKEALEQLKKADQTPEVTEQMQRLERQIADDEAALKKLEKQSEDFGSVAKQQFKAVGEQLQKTGEAITAVGEKLAPVSAAAAALGGGLLKLGYDAVTGADDLNTLSKQTGISTDSLQRMQYASDLVDVSLEDITGSLRKMKPKMDENNKTFQELGVAVTDTDGNLRNVEDVFYDTLEALSKIENETERDKIAMELFGKGADSLAGIIDDGGQALRDYGQAAADAGLILSQDTLDALNETNDTIDQLKAEMAGTMAQIGADVATILAPVLENVAAVVSKIAEALRNLTPEQEKMILTIIAIVAALAPVLIALGNLISTIGLITIALPGIAAAAAPVIAVLTGPVALAIAAVVAAGIILIKNWDAIKEAFRQMGEGLKRDWETLKNAVVTTITNLQTTAVQKFNDLKTAVLNTAENIRSAAVTKFNAVKEAITKPIETAKTTVTNAINKIKDIVNNAKLSLPHIKLPHFKVKGGQVPWGIGGVGTPPSISIDWYKRAYDNPVIFQQPTVLPTVGGLKGFGDGHGAEIVMSLNKLQELVGQQSSPVYMTINAAPGMDVRELAQEVSKELAFAQRSKNAVYA